MHQNDEVNRQRPEGDSCRPPTPAPGKPTFPTSTRLSADPCAGGPMEYDPPLDPFIRPYVEALSEAGIDRGV